MRATCPPIRCVISKRRADSLLRTSRLMEINLKWRWNESPFHRLDACLQLAKGLPVYPISYEILSPFTAAYAILARSFPGPSIRHAPLSRTSFIWLLCLHQSLTSRGKATQVFPSERI